MKRLPWKYLAGLIDGEGCIDVQITRVKGYEDRYYIRPRVRICMADNAAYLLEMIANTNKSHLSHREHKNPVWQNATELSFDGYKRGCSFLRNIVNHLFLKKEQARFCLWMEQNIKGKHVPQQVRDAVREELRLMKKDPHRLSEKAQDKVLAML